MVLSIYECMHFTNVVKTIKNEVWINDFFFFFLNYLCFFFFYIATIVSIGVSSGSLCSCLASI